MANLYAPRLQALADRFAPQGVAFLGISSNVQDSVTELAAYARVHGLRFPILKDLSNQVADRLGATRTPQVFVLDKDRTVRYCGRVDGQVLVRVGRRTGPPLPARRPGDRTRGAASRQADHGRRHRGQGMPDRPRRRTPATTARSPIRTRSPA